MFECAVCDKNFPHQDALDEHLSIHTRERPTCTVCQKTFSKRESLDQHFLTHTGEESLEREVCGKQVEADRRWSDSS